MEANMDYYLYPNGWPGIPMITIKIKRSLLLKPNIKSKGVRNKKIAQP